MNISTELEKGLNQSQLTALHIIGSECDQKSVKAFLVGGTVRDVLLSRDVSDIDIAIEGHPSCITDSMSQKGSLEVISTSNFGTQKTRMGDIKIDLAMARTEEYPVPVALPKVLPSDINEDLKRRDFTVNSMAVSLSDGSWGQLLDPHEGLLDIRRKQIRILHSNSFRDDPTRIFRAFRYSMRLDFSIDPLTNKLITDSVELVNELSGSRIVNELACIYKEHKVVSILKRLEKDCVFANIHEGWSFTERIFDSIELLIKCDPFDANALFVVLTAELTQRDREELFIRLNLDNASMKSISDFSIVEGFDTSINPSDLYNKLKPCSSSAIRAGKAFFTKTRRERLVFFSDKLKNFILEIDGNDLLALGISEGPTVGATLKLLQDCALDQGITGRKAQMELVVKLLVN